VKNRKKWTLGIVAVVTLILCSWAVRDFTFSSIEKATDSEVVTTLKGYAKAEENYFREYQEFGLGEEKIGFSAESKHMKAFFTKEALPSKYQEVLKENLLPYVAKDSYRILLANERQDKNRIEFWIVSNSHDPVKLEQYVLKE
jgi:hypothetical protein